MKIKWKCKHCSKIVTSDSTKRWAMDSCKCGKTAMDLEEGYSRSIGAPIILERDGVKEPTQ